MTASDEAFLLAHDLVGTPAEMAARIGELMISYPRFLLDGATRREVLARQRQVRARDIELAGLRHRMAMDFGRTRGWSLTASGFDVTALSGRRRVDHGCAVKVDWPRAYAEHSSRYAVGRQAVGLVCHLHDVSLGERRSAAAWARSNGLAASFPDFPSWLLPGRTAVVLFEAMGGTAPG